MVTYNLCSIIIAVLKIQIYKLLLQTYHTLKMFECCKTMDFRRVIKIQQAIIKVC